MLALPVPVDLPFDPAACSGVVTLGGVVVVLFVLLCLYSLFLLSPGSSGLSKPLLTPLLFIPHAPGRPADQSGECVP